MSFSESSPSPFLAPENSPERERQDIEKGKKLYEFFRSKEMFDRRFIGFDNLEERFSLPDGTRCLEVTDELKNHAYRTLAQKFHEGDVAVWWDRIQIGKDIPISAGLSQKDVQKWLIEQNALPGDEMKKKKWMLIYHPKAEMRTSLEDPALRGPITIRSLMSVVDTGLTNQGRATRFVRFLWEVLEGESWLNDTLAEGWEFVTEEMEPTSRSKTLDAQNKAIRDLSEDEYFERSERKFRKPIDIVFDCALAQAAGVPHLAGYNYERTQQLTDAEALGDGSPGGFVRVGRSSIRGVSVSVNLPSDVPSDIGACPFR